MKKIEEVLLKRSGGEVKMFPSPSIFPYSFLSHSFLISLSLTHIFSPSPDCVPQRERKERTKAAAAAVRDDDDQGEG